MRKFVGEYVSALQGEELIYAKTGPRTSMEAAMKDAIEAGKKANVMEWVSVTESVWVGHKITGYWNEVQRWTGDYEFQEEQFA